MGIDFEVHAGELVIVDEADCFFFGSPDNFMKLVKETACICFTATPDNKDPNGVEARLLRTFGITKFNYMIGNDEEEEKQKKSVAVDISKDITKEAATSIEQKVAFVQKKVKEGPVLVYCGEDLVKALSECNSKFVRVDPGHEFDSAFLRALDKADSEGQYPLIVTTSTFGMRGIDYRSSGASMHLVIAKSFDTERDALQGLNRVGRFGDSCTRTVFADVAITNIKSSIISKGRINKFLAGADKQKVQIKHVKVKELVVTKAPRNSWARNVKRADALLKGATTTPTTIDTFFKQHQ